MLLNNSQHDISNDGKNSKNRVLKRFEMPKAVSIIFVLLSSIIISLGVIYFTPGSSREFLLRVQQNFFLIVLNILPVILFSLLIFMILNNAVLTTAISGVFFLSLSLINRAKIQLRQDALMPSDLTLFDEIYSLIDKFDTRFKVIVIFVVVFSIAVIALSAFLFKSQKFSHKVRIICSLSIVVVSAVINFTVYSSEGVYNSLPFSGNEFFKVNHTISKGFLYSFIYEFNYQRKSFEDYTPYVFDEQTNSYIPTTYDKISSQYEPKSYDDIEKPHVIMIMSEAFTDLALNENLDFEGYTDPLEYYKEFIKRDDVLSGHIIVPNYGGGTSDTEFDVLTGCFTEFINSSQPSYEFVTRDLNGITMILNDNGYRAQAIHPGSSWFYNRENVYRHMGFGEFLNLDNYFNLEEDNIAGYVKEEVHTSAIIREFEKHLALSSDPLFQFSVTIENHGPYNTKFGKHVEFSSHKNLSRYEINLLSNYFYGLADCDRQIKELVEYFEKSDEPVVLVFFGDHLPGFDVAESIFEKLEYDISYNQDIQQLQNMYKTPFFIWQNESANKITKIAERTDSIKLPPNKTISASYLGSLMFELIGFDDVSPLTDTAIDLLQKLPVISNRGYMDSNGIFYEDCPEQYSKEAETLVGWTEYRLIEEKR